MSDITDPVRKYQAAARAVGDITRRIASITRWGQPCPDSVDGKILPSLIARRDREALALIPLRIAADEAAPKRSTHDGSHITFKTWGWHPAGTVSIDLDRIPPIPDCLKRERREP